MFRDRQQLILLVLGAVGLAGLVLVGYLFYSAERAEPTVQISLPAPDVKPLEPVAPAVVAEPPPPDLPDSERQPPARNLPPLADSDSLIREGLATLTRHPEIARWLTADELIRKFVVLVDNLANGKVPKRHVDFLAPAGSLVSRPRDQQTWLLDAGNYARFDTFTEVFASIDAKRAVDFYLLLRPLFQEAYDELGYGTGTFDAALVEAMEELLAAPVIETPIVLTRPRVAFEFADPALESSSQAHKQLIRMGPENTRRIQQKLTELLAQLQAAR